MISKYADNYKVFAKEKSNGDYVAIQTDLNRVQEWSNKWKMDINKDKCHVLQFGKENKQITYKFADQGLQSVEEEKDLGVQINSTGKSRLQCA